VFGSATGFGAAGCVFGSATGGLGVSCCGDFLHDDTQDANATKTNMSILSFDFKIPCNILLLSPFLWLSCIVPVIKQNTHADGFILTDVRHPVNFKGNCIR